MNYTYRFLINKFKFYLYPLSPTTSIFIFHFGPSDKEVDYAYSESKYKEMYYYKLQLLKLTSLILLSCLHAESHAHRFAVSLLLVM